MVGAPALPQQLHTGIQTGAYFVLPHTHTYMHESENRSHNTSKFHTHSLKTHIHTCINTHTLTHYTLKHSDKCKVTFNHTHIYTYI